MTNPKTRHVLVGSHRAALNWCRMNSVNPGLMARPLRDGPISITSGLDISRRLAGVRGPLTVVKLHDWVACVGFGEMSRLRELVAYINGRDGAPDAPVSTLVRFTVPGLVAPTLPYDDDGVFVPGIGPVCEAMYDGRCPNCGDRIDQGDLIRMQDGRAVHDGCEGD